MYLSPEEYEHVADVYICVMWNKASPFVEL